MVAVGIVLLIGRRVEELVELVVGEEGWRNIKNILVIKKAFLCSNKKSNKISAVEHG